MDWTRMFECSHDGKRFGLVFVEAETWLLRVRFFRDKSALSLVEGISWLREFVRKNLDRSVRELHGRAVCFCLFLFFVCANAKSKST